MACDLNTHLSQKKNKTRQNKQCLTVERLGSKLVSDQYPNGLGSVLGVSVPRVFVPHRQMRDTFPLFSLK